MSTLIEWADEDGEIVGRCDARCHFANPDSPCHCLCGGKYHGAGTKGILEIIQQEEGAEILENAKKIAKFQGVILVDPDDDVADLDFFNERL
jgi:hypothetical protein